MALPPQFAKKGKKAAPKKGARPNPFAKGAPPMMAPGAGAPPPPFKKGGKKSLKGKK